MRPTALKTVGAKLIKDNDQNRVNAYYGSMKLENIPIGNIKICRIRAKRTLSISTMATMNRNRVRNGLLMICAKRQRSVVASA